MAMVSTPSSTPVLVLEPQAHRVRAMVRTRSIATIFFIFFSAFLKLEFSGYFRQNKTLNRTAQRLKVKYGESPKRKQPDLTIALHNIVTVRQIFSDGPANTVHADRIRFGGSPFLHRRPHGLAAGY